VRRRLDRTRPLLCFIHDTRRPAIPRSLREVPDRDWRAVDLLQLRGKGLPAGELEILTRAWVERLAGLGPFVIVNDRLDVALATDADGVHLGQDDLPIEAARRGAGPDLLIGASTHDKAEIVTAETAGADYVGLGAFFTTVTKPEALPLDYEAAEVAAPAPEVRIPVLAIGGLTAGRVAQALEVPVVTGIAASSAIQAADDPANAIRRLRRELDDAWARRKESGVE
jgi:thiamine-phosphate pyrophosphorylase